MKTNRFFSFGLAVLTSLSCSLLYSGTPSAEGTIPTPEDVTSQPQPVTVDFFEGVPIMPGAVSGRAVGTSYSYQIDASVLDVQRYYLQEMPLAGWELEDQTGDAEIGETSVRLRYYKGDETIAVFISGADGGLTEVTIL